MLGSLNDNFLKVGKEYGDSLKNLIFTLHVSFCSNLVRIICFLLDICSIEVSNC